MNDLELHSEAIEGNLEEVFYVAGWQVFSNLHRIVRGEDVVKLEPKVMQVLIYLSSRAGQVISRQELEDTIWSDRIVGYDAVSNTIIKLRKAFGDNSRDPSIIETIPKIGYRLIADVKSEEVLETLHPVIKEQGQKQSKSEWFHRPTWQFLLVIFTFFLVLILIAWFSNTTSYRQKTRVATLPSGKTSIAVLPFKNLGDNPNQEYFSDGITEDIITDLSKIAGLRVVASNSTFAYKNSLQNESSISQELGVVYLLKGSVQKHHKRIRLNVRLVDARSSNNIWAERYDRQLTDIFHIQDELTTKIVTALEVNLAPEDKKRLTRNYIVKIEAYDAFLRGLDYYDRRSVENSRLAKQQFTKSIELDPGFARGYAALALSHSWDVVDGWSSSSKDSLLKASELADKALKLDKLIPQVYFVKGFIELQKRNYELAAEYAQQAIEIEPNYADGYALLAWILHHAGRPNEGLEAMESAIKLNPRIPSVYLLVRGSIFYSLRQMENAIEDFKVAIQMNPLYLQVRVWLAASYISVGKTEKAQWEVEEILAIKPNITVKKVSQAYPIKDAIFLDRLKNDLKKAGLP